MNVLANYHPSLLAAISQYLHGQNWQFTSQEFEALLRGCEKHIEKFGRLIITDLHTQLNVTMHLVDATNGIFHTIINNEDDGISLRNYYTGAAFEMMPDHILVPHPSMTDENGRPKLVTIRQAKSNA